MKHVFDVNIAEKYGLVCAILFEHIQFWVAKNKANEQNFYRGRFWMPSSIKEFQKSFPYLTTNQIRGALDKLESEGLIYTGCFNEDKRDRTKWYSISVGGEYLYPTEHGSGDEAI